MSQDTRPSLGGRAGSGSGPHLCSEHLPGLAGLGENESSVRCFFLGLRPSSGSLERSCRPGRAHPAAAPGVRTPAGGDPPARRGGFLPLCVPGCEVKGLPRWELLLEPGAGFLTQCPHRAQGEAPSVRVRCGERLQFESSVHSLGKQLLKLKWAKQRSHVFNRGDVGSVVLGCRSGPRGDCSVESAE